MKARRSGLREHQRFGRRKTFREIVADSRDASAAAAWCRAKTASQLRHVAVRQGRPHSATILARIKATAVARAVAILPRRVRVTLDSSYQVGLLSVQWDDRERLHLPPAAAIPLSAPSSAEQRWSSPEDACADRLRRGHTSGGGHRSCLSTAFHRPRVPGLAAKERYRVEAGS